MEERNAPDGGGPSLPPAPPGLEAPARRPIGAAGGPDGAVVPLIGLPGRLRSTARMRNGPDATYAILGTIPRGALVPVVGRNADATWLQVVYPPTSQLRGWVDASLLN